MAEPRVYVYKLIADNGGAPCVQDGLLSLAICKPWIRRAARVGDLVFGFAGTTLERGNPLIYAARVTAVAQGEYYTDERWAGRWDRIYQRGPPRASMAKRLAVPGPRDGSMGWA